MRIRHLALERYGHFTDHVFDLPKPDGPDLWIIHGDNEAGKTTTLNAIREGLFGVDHRPAYGFRHGDQSLCVGMTLEGPAGSVSFRRRKGRSKTLMDADDSPLPEDMLAPWLGAYTAEIFSREFGLSLDRLRQGTEEMLEAKGDLGRILVQAGTGLDHLIATQKDLTDRAEALYKIQGRSQPLYKAFVTFNAAEKAMKAATVKVSALDAARKALAAAAGRRKEITDRRGTLAAEERGLLRLKQVRGLIARLDRVEAGLAERTHIPLLAADVAARLSALEKDRAVLDARERALAEQRDSLLAEREALTVDPALRAVAGDLEQLRRRREAAEEAREALDGSRRAATAARDAVVRLIAEAGLTATPDTLEEVLLGAPEQRALADLVQRAEVLDARLSERRRTVTQRRAALERLAGAEAGAGPEEAIPDATALRRAVEVAAELGNVDDQIARAHSDVARQAAKVDRLAADLAPWQGPLTALQSLPVPSVGQLRMAGEALEKAEKEQTAATEALRDIDRQLGEVTRRLEHLSAGADSLPTAEAIAEARAARDALWAGTVEEAMAGGLTPLTATAFERALRAADVLVDRRAAELRRVSDFEAQKKERDALSTRRGEAARLRASAQEALAAADTAWRDLWAPCRMRPDGPADMVDWLKRRQALMQEAELCADLERRQEAMAAQRQAARSALRREAEALGGSVPEGAGFADLRRAAQDVLNGVDERRRAAAQARQRLAEARESLADAEQDLAETRAEYADWQDRWAHAVPKVNRAPETVPAEVQGVLDLQGALRAAHGDWRRAEAEATARAATLEAFARFVEALAARLGDAEGSAGDRDCFALARSLEARAADALETEARAARLAERLEGLEAELRHCRETAVALAAAEKGLLAETRCADLDEVRPRLEEAAEKARLIAERDRLLADLEEVRDGQDLDALRCALAERDGDAVEQRLSAVGDEREVLQQDLEAAVEEETRARGALDGLVGQDGAVDAAQAAEAAAAEIADLGDEWLRLRAAERVLNWAMERYRERNQAPLLRKAEGLFATLTTGGFPRLRMDGGGSEALEVFGVRPSGEQVPTGAMSEGTLDQLSLALRLAALELRAETQDPLPLIADDLFSAFDDTRAAAGLEALAEVAGRVQVLFFTHHRHLADIAARSLGDRCRLVSLGGGA